LGTSALLEGLALGYQSVTGSNQMSQEIGFFLGCNNTSSPSFSVPAKGELPSGIAKAKSSFKLVWFSSDSKIDTPRALSFAAAFVTAQLHLHTLFLVYV
jgi:hypothetical protein